MCDCAFLVVLVLTMLATVRLWQYVQRPLRIGAAEDKAQHDGEVWYLLP